MSSLVRCGYAWSSAVSFGRLGDLAQDVFHGDARPADDGLAQHDLGIDLDALVDSHGSLHGSCPARFDAAKTGARPERFELLTSWFVAMACWGPAAVPMPKNTRPLAPTHARTRQALATR